MVTTDVSRQSDQTLIAAKLDEIQILRAIAALLVVLHHVLLTAPRYYPSSPNIAQLGFIGQIGVDIFLSSAVLL